ncbi:hypothetical protein ACU5AX_20520, partial [Sphingomonas sp. XXL09]|uniref:hypothetical protein n=1 Tax=Sphingomonas sp. XXL09 TaxID=3457787 RepID=UPI00406BA1C7
MIFQTGSDVTRLREITRQVISQFGKITGYADYIKAFAENIVHQMQAARLLRINHGALSASN